jgi:hypothetical protein
MAASELKVINLVEKYEKFLASKQNHPLCSSQPPWTTNTTLRMFVRSLYKKLDVEIPGINDSVFSNTIFPIAY